MDLSQKEITLAPYPRGFHIITKLIEKETINKVKTGLLHIFIKHSSASLTINENADPTVRQDFESHFNIMIPENAKHYKHTLEGKDDMPAHLKSSILGSSLTIPISNYKLNLGTWQGIYLCEHRDYGGSRQLVLTIIGE